MSVQNPYQFPGLNPTAVVQNPVGLQAVDTTAMNLNAGRQGDLITSPWHGPFGAAASRGVVFTGAASSAGSTIAVVTTTSSCTFALNNPLTSTKNVEFIRFALNFLDTNAAPSTANVIGFSMVNNNTNAASAITKMPDPLVAGGHPVNFGSTTPAASLCSAITFASALTVAANWTLPMFSFPASWVPTVGGSPVPYFYDFNGSFIVPPGYTACLLASTAWGANTVVPSLTWMEYLP